MKPITCLVAATVAVALAIPAHAQVDCADWNTEAFFEAAVVSDVTRCLQAGADTDVRNDDGGTPLHMAALGGSAEAVMTLLEAGADVEARNDNDWTPLHYAARWGVPQS